MRKNILKSKYILLTLGLLVVVVVILFCVAFPVKTNIDSEYIGAIKNYYSIQLPSKGEVKIYNEGNGEIDIIEIYMNKKDYNYVINQLKQLEVAPYGEELSMYHDMEDSDIEGTFYVTKRVGGVNEYHMSMDKIFVSSVNNGKFRILVEKGGMDIE